MRPANVSFSPLTAGAFARQVGHHDAQESKNVNRGVLGATATSPVDDSAEAGPPDSPDNMERTAEQPLSAINPTRSIATSFGIDLISTSYPRAQVRANLAQNDNRNLKVCILRVLRRLYIKSIRQMQTHAQIGWLLPHRMALLGLKFFRVQPLGAPSAVGEGRRNGIAVKVSYYFSEILGERRI